jgi:hypothetical protein
LADQPSQSAEEKREVEKRAAKAFERYTTGESVWEVEKHVNRERGILGFLTDALETILLD